MKRVLEAEVEYKANPIKAMARFAKRFPDVWDVWGETIEWMFESNTQHFIDDRFADGTKNTEWGYSIWAERNDDYTYICVIERA